MTNRHILILAWITAFLLILAVVLTSLYTAEPCAGLTGEERSICEDIYYP